MELTKEDISVIRDFCKNEKLANGFIELYNYEKYFFNDLEFDHREELIGFRRSSEKLRMYLVRSQKTEGLIYIKFKTMDTPAIYVRFNPVYMEQYKQMLLEVNRRFEEGIWRYTKQAQAKLKAKEEAKKSKKSEKLSMVALKQHQMAAEEISQLRTSFEMSRGEFAELIGVSVGALSSWESGSSTPSGAVRKLLILLTIDKSTFDKLRYVN